MHRLRLAIQLAVALHPAIGTTSGPLPASDIVCPLVRSAPTIDGDIQPREWERAVVVSRFRDTRTGADAPADTRVLLCHDDLRLYLAAECHYRPGHIVASFSKAADDEDLWRGDCLEVFLAPDLRRPESIQLIIDSAGLLFDALHGAPNSESPSAWNLSPPPKIATRTRDNVLTIETAIEFAAIGSGRTPARGDVWGVKFARTHWDRSPTTRRDRPGTVYTASVPGGGSYLARPYAALIFGARTARSRESLAQLGDRRQGGAHPYHGLEAVKSTHVWAKPGTRLTREGVSFGERLIFTDTATGAEIWRLTFNPGVDGVSYANVYPWNCDGSLMMFSGRQRMNGHWYMLLSGDATRIWRPAGGASMVSPRWSRDAATSVLCSSGRKLLRIDVLTGEQATIGQLPESVEGRVAFGPLGRYAVACKRGFGKEGKLTLIDLTTGAVRPIPLRTASQSFSGDWLYSGRAVYVGDTPHVGYSLNHLPHLSAEHRYQQWVMNLDTGEYRQVKYLSHGGTSPARDRKVGFAGGGIWMTDWFGDDRRFVAPITGGGHIAWMSSPLWCVAGMAGRPGRSPFASQLIQVFVDSGDWRRIAYGQTANTTYASYLFANTSPDGTKCEFSSTMLGPKDIYWAIINRPEPPSGLTATRLPAGVRLRWSPPRQRREIRGYHVWRSTSSGRDYRLVSGREPIAGLTWLDEKPVDGEPAYYLVTSVEHSTLESHEVSNETVAPPAGESGWLGACRWFVEAETGLPSPPMGLGFSGDASANSFMIVGQRADGPRLDSLRLSASVPKSAAYRLWVRLRAGTEKPGQLDVTYHGASVARWEVSSRAWQWQCANSPIRLDAGHHELTLTSPVGVCAVDKLLLTDDERFTPTGDGRVDTAPPSTPANLSVEDVTRFEVSLKWSPAPEADCHHYQVYRSRSPGFTPSQASLVGSPSRQLFIDWGLEPATRYHYCVTAVDVFGNESAPARLTTDTRPLGQRVLVQMEAENARSINGEGAITEAKDASAGKCMVLPKETVTRTAFRLLLPFRIAREDDYMVWLSLCPMADEHVYLKVGIDDGPTALLYLFDSQRGEIGNRLMWRPAGAVGGPYPMFWHLQPGDHELVLSLVGQPGFANRVTALDRAIVTNDRSFQPSGRIWDWD